jgi:hypothetical protein
MAIAEELSGGASGGGGQGRDGTGRDAVETNAVPDHVRPDLHRSQIAQQAAPTASQVVSGCEAATSALEDHAPTIFHAAAAEQSAINTPEGVDDHDHADPSGRLVSDPDSFAPPFTQLVSPEPRTRIARPPATRHTASYAEVAAPNPDDGRRCRAKVYGATLILTTTLFIQNGHAMLDIISRDKRRDTVLARIETTWRESFVDEDTANKLGMMILPNPPPWVGKSVHIPGRGKMTLGFFAIFRAITVDDGVVEIRCRVLKGLHPCGFIAGRPALLKLGWAKEGRSAQGGLDGLSEPFSG